MIPGDRDLRTLGPWPAGANNLAAEHNVPRPSFREGTNVRVADDGRISRREGRAKLFEAIEPHSMFGQGLRAFYAEQTQLMATELYPDGSLAEPLPIFTGLRIDAPLAYCLIEPDIYVSDGLQTLRLRPDNTVLPWAPPPAPAPSATLTAGALPPGRYHVALAYKLANGEEGPLSAWTALDVAEGQGILLAFPPVPAEVDRQLIFMTKPNGAALLFFGSVPVGATQATLSKQRLGRAPVSDGLDQMPPARFAAYFAGRLLVGLEDLVVWSEPNQYSLTSLEFNYMTFSEPVTGIGVVGETTNGFFVGQLSRTYFVSGSDPNDTQLNEVYPAGIVPGTLSHVPGARLPLENPPTVPVPVWLATNGVICVGLQDGTILPLTEPRFAADVGCEGASVFEQRDGMSRYIVTTKNPDENVFAVRDQVSIEVVRNGITP
jgi:hypothetical protein